jgi:hypothetical protein
MRVNSEEGTVTRASYSVSGMLRLSDLMSMSFMSYSAMRSESRRALVKRSNKSWMKIQGDIERESAQGRRQSKG